jgi:hypothetical protein
VIAIPSATVLAGILIKSHRILDVQQHFNQRFSSLEKLIEVQGQMLHTELRRFEEVMDARLTRIEQELKIR